MSTFQKSVSDFTNDFTVSHKSASPQRTRRQNCSLKLIVKRPKMPFSKRLIVLTIRGTSRYQIKLNSSTFLLESTEHKEIGRIQYSKIICSQTSIANYELSIEGRPIGVVSHVLGQNLVLNFLFNGWHLEYDSFCQHFCAYNVENEIVLKINSKNDTEYILSFSQKEYEIISILTLMIVDHIKKLKTDSYSFQSIKRLHNE